MKAQNSNTDERSIPVRLGRVDSVKIYEATESELEFLENGEPIGIYFNFAIFLLSIAITGISALYTATFENKKVENTFLFISIIGVLGGLFLLILWWHGRKFNKSIISKIRNRIPSE